MPSIVWFYRDLRLSDNAALAWAASRGPIIPVYILDDAAGDGAASRWWLHEALVDLKKDLHELSVPLVLRRGDPLTILRRLIAETGATSVSWARRYEPDLTARDDVIIASLKEDGITVTTHLGYLLFEPAHLRTQSGNAFKVFSPFSKACFAAPAPETPIGVPKNIQGVPNVPSDQLDAWKLVPQSAVWPKGLTEAWDVGEKAGQKSLKTFVQKQLLGYHSARNRPDIEGTSRLSPYLHFGQISPRQAWFAGQRAQSLSSAVAQSVERFLLEILWREFSWHLLVSAPEMTTEPLQKSFVRFPWRQDASGLRAWQKGETGFPIVDAGLRQLWKTGWMHNRVRMIVASFLVKDLLLDWRHGMAWFWDTLVDADLGSNTVSWQWVAGCGADAAPYFRVFNPTLQGEKFDPEGNYVRAYVPELARLDNNSIHEPTKATQKQLSDAGVVLGQTYPHPIVDHARARLRALEALKDSKNEMSQGLGPDDLFD